MAEKETITNHASLLRLKAEEKKSRLAEFPEAFSPEETQHMFHELQVHQIELEMQNEELRTRQMELDAARKRYIDLYDLAPVGYCTTCEKGLIIETNLTAVMLLGTTRAEMVNRPFGRLIQAEYADIYLHRSHALFKTSKPQTFDVKMKKNDGTTFWAHLVASTVEGDDNRPVCRIVIVDISEAEDVMLANWAKLEAALAGMTDAVLISDVQGRLIDFNNAFATFHRFKNKEACPKNMSEYPAFLNIYTSDGNPAPFDQWAIPRALRGESEKNIEYTLHRKDTGDTWVGSYSFAPIRNKDGVIVGSVVSGRDLTEQKRMEMELREARHHLEAQVQERTLELSAANAALKSEIAERRQLERRHRQIEKAESLNRMAGAIAHHFNNQLYVVIGNLEMVMDDLPLESDCTEKLIDAMKASHKAADMSQLMLTYLGQTPGRLEMLDLSETCHKSLLMLQANIPGKVQVEPEFPFPGPTIRANMNQLLQIVSCLVINACESVSDSSGVVRITVNTVSAADIPASNRFPVNWQPQEDIYACLEVADTGCGIADHDIEKIFDPFFSTKFIGRGLGLSVALGILSAHDGGITVESSVGKGSVFRVFLPTSTEVISIPLEKAYKIPIKEEAATVLLIEDEPQVRNMARLMLIRLGYKVLEATDGVEAVDIFQKHRDEIRCVLSDLTMPRMNGWDTLAALRQISPEIPVILSSGFDEAQVMAGEHCELPNAFLGKPYQLKALRETIDRIL
jgi:PAS domain S-box-containing protein